VRTWIAAHARTTCGFAGCRIDAGDPVQVIEIGGLPKRFRCQEHAQGKVDWDAVEASKRSEYRPSSPERGAFTRLSRVKPPIDVKALQAGSDE